MITVKKFEKNDSYTWDNFISEHKYPFILTRKFIDYHGDRFLDESILFYDTSGLIAVYPAARDPVSDYNVLSHPGLTYGGLLYDKRLKFPKIEEIFKLLLEYYKKANARSLVYKLIPSFYFENLMHSEVEEFLLHKYKFSLIGCDLSSVVDLRKQLTYSNRRKRGIKKANTRNFILEKDPCEIRKYWDVLEENLSSKHGRKPVHSISEIELLINKFPQNIKLFSVIENEQLIAGTLIFRSNACAHAQYIASNTTGKKYGALDYLFINLLEIYKKEYFNFFDFGISTLNGGFKTNDGLLQFKSEFGSQNLTYKQYARSL
jgi:hypothetical protein